MTWLKTSEERANNYSLENPNTPLGAILMGGNKSFTGRAVSDKSALSLSPFFAGVKAIAGDLATVPLKVYRRRSDGGREEARDHELWPLLHDSPAPLLTSAAWRSAKHSHVLMRGNAYSAVDVNGRGRITGIFPLHPDKVERLGSTYVYRDTGFEERIPAEHVLHIAGPGDGIDGWSVLKLARESIGLALALEESNARFIANASRPSGFLTTDEKLNREALTTLKSQWGARTGGLDNVGRTPILDNGLRWEQVGLSAEDAQFLQSREFQLTEIARWLNITPHKLHDLSHGTFSNVEHLGIEYYRATLRPWFVTWEQAMNMKLLTDKDRRDGIYIEFVVDGLLRGDVQTRTEAYRAQFDMGGLTPNELRALEGRNPVPGGDEAYVRLDMRPLSQPFEPPTEGDDERKAVPTIETRASGMQSRLNLREAFRPQFLDAAGRLVRGEIRNVKRLLKDDRTKIEDYYLNDLAGFAEQVMGPVFRGYAESVSLAAQSEVDRPQQINTTGFSGAYTDTFARMHAAKSRKQLLGLDDEQIEERLTVWADGGPDTSPRHEQIASQHVVELGDAVARAVWVASGVTSLIWRTVGDSCPFCRKLNGVRVSSDTGFLQKGEALEAEGEVLTPKTAIRHAPAHRGCNCTIGVE